MVRIAKYLDVTPESLYTSGADKGSDMASAVDPTGADKGDVIEEICRRVMSLTALQRAEVLQRLVELVVIK